MGAENQKAYSGLAQTIVPDNLAVRGDAPTAASEELLEACKMALPMLHWANCHGSRCDEVIQQAEAAIAKAEPSTKGI